MSREMNECSGNSRHEPRDLSELSWQEKCKSERDVEIYPHHIF